MIRILAWLFRALVWRTLGKSVSIEDASQRFLALSRKWGSGRPKPARHYLHQMLKFYTATRIDGTRPMERSDDILELAFMSNGLPLGESPIDARSAAAKLTYADQNELRKFQNRLGGERCGMGVAS